MDWKEKAEQLYAYLESVLQQTGDLVVEQTPLLVQEFFMWFTVHHIFYVILGVLLFLLSIYLHQLGSDEKDRKRGKDLYDGTQGFWVFIVVPTGFVGVLMFFTNLYSLLQILVAPRIYLLEKLSTWFS